tara:strand:- start:850 stop:1728 length:879 start_codon:yes stop_codon:yes gene_type:complete
MIASMTGYGKADKKNKNYFVNVEIKSVNNRFFDHVIKIHPSIKEFEPSIISLLKKECERGKFFLNITVGSNTNKSHFKLNKDLLKSYLQILKDIDKETNSNEIISSIELMRLPDLLENVDIYDKSSSIKKIIFDALKLAIKDLNNFRKEEGSNLLKEINKQVNKIESIFKRIEKKSIKNTQKELANYKKKIKNYMPNFSKLDDERLYQEIGIIIEKKDINEEIVRFKSHLDLFHLYLKNKKNEGKKKNFLLQEMNREINTIGSKSDDTKVKHCVVDIKNNLEKLREQVQNIL